MRTKERIAEVGWFDDLCGGDTQFLGVLDPSRSTYEHCIDVLKTTETAGFRNILLPSSYLKGQEVLPFAAAAATQITKIKLLTAIRTGEIYPPMLARHIATLDHMLKGRLTINIINSDLPGLKEPAAFRYQRCIETIEILKQAWTQDEIHFEGQHYQVHLAGTEPVRPFRVGGPLLYFGGISDGSREICAQYCDVFLMWPEPEGSIIDTIHDMTRRAAARGREIDFGLRVHVIVRDTEQEARDYAKYIMSRFEPEKFNLKYSAQDAGSAGVLRQDAFRAQTTLADDYLEPFLWGGVGRARSGCGAAIVGTPEQVLEKLHRYMDLGIRAFILSGYPLKEEAIIFGEKVLPHLPLATLSQL